jgi:hypothetical protein
MTGKRRREREPKLQKGEADPILFPAKAFRK